MHITLPEEKPSVYGAHRAPASGAARTRASAPGASQDAQGEASAAPLVNIASNAVSFRFIRRALSSRWLLSAHEQTVRVARCSWAIGQTVGVRSDKGKSNFESVETCSSVWACPACSAVIRQRRAREIQQAVESHQKAGKILLFVTLTLPHRKHDSLDSTLDALLSGWRELTAQTAYKKVAPGVRSSAGIKERYGITGFIRTTEVTYSPANGWHPHLHLLFFLDREDISRAEIRAFGDEVHTLWARIIQRRLGRKPTRTRGIDVQQVDNRGSVLARYLSKVQDGEEKTGSWSVGAEMARGDVKKAKKNSITPFQLLDDEVCAGLNRGHRRALWLEFYSSTHGRRCLSWSKGLKAYFGIDDVDDETVMEAEIQAVPMRYVAPTPAYRALSPVEKARVLVLAEVNEWGKVYEILPGVLLPALASEPPPPA